MHKIIFSLLICFLSSAEASEVWIEGKVAYFYPTSHKFRQIYGKNAIYGAEITVPLQSRFALWASADYNKENGRSIGLHNKTTASIIPLGFGLKYFIPFYKADFYFGAGVDYIFLNVHNHSRYVKNVHRQGWGWSTKTGIIVDLTCNWFIDISANYTNKWFTFHRAKANISFASAGIGIGYKL